MSTIASPREPGAPFPPRRIPSSSSATTTRPSLDIPALPQRSRSPNPNPNPNPSSPSLSATTSANNQPPGPRTRANRAALREYYKLPKSSLPPAVEVTDPLGIHQHHQNQHGPESPHSEVPLGELDAPGFAAGAYVARALAESSLEELLRAYARAVGEARALDAEREALVYDNYSKLISATETIRKMRSTMDPLTPMASTLDPAIAQIYSQACSIRDSLREVIPEPAPAPTSSSPPPPPTTQTTQTPARLRTKQLALAALEAPDKVRALVAAGRAEEARQAWEMPRRLLVLWKEKGLGGAGEEVEACIRDGDAALRGEESTAAADGDGGGDEGGEGD